MSVFRAAIIFTAFSLGLLTLPALAACPNQTISHNWAIESGDQRVSGDYMNKLVAGRKVRLGNNQEHYRKNGRYSVRVNGQTFNADSYRFYSDGSRCIGYDEPRFDLYVVQNGQLILINVNGGRFAAQVTN